MTDSDGLRLLDPQLQTVADKVREGERLGRDDGLILASSSDLLGVGRLANLVREQIHGDVTYYNINRHLNPTNVCVASCRLCAFYVPFRDRERGWTWSVDEAVRVAERDVDESVSELHIVGGLHPKLRLEYYEELFTALKTRFPWVHLKALTMVELDFLASLCRTSVEEVVERLKAAGLGSCPGGGAEIFAERVRQEICDHKTDGARWLEVAGIVHRAGLKSNCTMLYGHVERPEERVDHLLALRALQDETGGFQTFIPLAFHPENTPLDHLPVTTGLTDIRQVAVGRLMLDNFPHIKAYWQMMTPKIAQIAMRFGADDIDGTVIEEKIYHDAGATTPQGMTRRELCRLITEAGRVPVERDTLYHAVTRTEDSFVVAV